MLITQRNQSRAIEVPCRLGMPTEIIGICSHVRADSLFGCRVYWSPSLALGVESRSEVDVGRP